jgi:4-alpha-glucanotransferase
MQLHMFCTAPLTSQFLASTDGQPRAWLQLWQVLPLVPPEDTYWSPYSGLDALCGNPLLIDLEDLVTRGLLDPKDLPDEVPLPLASAQVLSRQKAS